MRVLILLLVLFLVQNVSSAQQISLQASAGWGPFATDVVVLNTFTVTNIPATDVVRSITFTIVGTDGGSQPLRTVATQTSTKLAFKTDMGVLPYSSSIIATVHTTSGSGLDNEYVTHHDISITNVKPTISSATGMGKIVVGAPAQHRFVVSSLPPSTTRLALHVLNANGAVIDSVVRVGAAIDSASILYKTTAHTKNTTLSVAWTTSTAPIGGYRTTMLLGDSTPLPRVRASLGWGPFQQGVMAVNNFTVKGLGASCTTVKWWIDAVGRYGMISGLDSAILPYSAVTDSVTFTSNMGVLLRNATLHVVAYYGRTTVDSARMDYPIQITQQSYGPHFFASFKTPLARGTAGIDTVSVDSLPVRATHVRLSMIDQNGNVYFRSNAYPVYDRFVDTARVVFDQSQLPLYTTTVRCEIWLDYEALPIEYDYSFDVRDTSLPYLFANSWGPFIQTDSAYIVLGAKWMRAVGSPTDTVLGQFSIRDSSNNAILFSSSLQSMKNVAYDSTVYWLDSTGNRPLIITGSFPLTAEARFTRYAIRGADTVELQHTRHPISMLPAPGDLVAVNGYGPFIAGRDSMNTFRITNLPPGTREVEFRVTGTRNPAAVDSMLVVPVGTGTLDSAVFTTNMGWLPVNARLHVNVRYDGGPDDGVQLDRFIHTIPDTLAITSYAGFGPLKFSWAFAQRSGSGRYDISGVAPIQTTFKIFRLPAQTLSIAIVTKDDAGNTIDSVREAVNPYQLRFNKAQTYSIYSVAYRQLNTSLLTVILFTDGGPGLGIAYPINIEVLNPDLTYDVHKVDVQGNSTANDTTAILQGSNDVLSLGVYLGNSPNGTPSLSMLPPYSMDSVRYRFRDCNGSVDDSLKSRTASVGAQTNIVADTMYTVTPLPITARTSEVDVYSSKLHFPRRGFTYIDSINIVPNPVVDTLYGRWYPSYRATDTVNGQMMQTYTLTHLGNVDSVTNIRWVGPAGQVVGTIPNQVPRNDSVRLTYNMNAFQFVDTQLRLVGTFVYHRCSDQSRRDIILDTALIDQQFPGPPNRNFIWSSLGWGPFRQGKPASSWFLISLEPSRYIVTHDSTDELVVQVVGVDSAGNTVFTLPPVTQIYSSAALPTTTRFRTQYQQLGGLAPNSFINVGVIWNKRLTTGIVRKSLQAFVFPVTMLPFPPQPISSDKGWGPFEQSVAAGGYGGINVMKAPMVVTDSVQSTIMGSIAENWYDHSNTFVGTSQFTKGTRRIVPDPKDPSAMDTIDIWTAAPYDPAQVGWPSVSRDAQHLDLEIDYTFQGFLRPTAKQSQVVSLTPRADWVNGTQITADSVVNDTIYLTSLIPLPAPGFEKTEPLLGPLPMQTARTDGGSGALDFKINVLYAPSTGQFSFNENSSYNNKGFTWNSSLSSEIIKGGRAAYVNDGDEHDGFKAQQDFVKEGARNNRELAIRQLITANLSGNLLAPYTIVKDAMEIIESGLVIISAAPTLALWVGSEQYYTLNLGTDGTGVLKYAGELPTSEVNAEEYKNKYQTGLANSFSSTLSRGVEVSIAGFFGAGISLDDQSVIGWGKTYSGGVKSIVEKDWPSANAQRTYFTVDLDLLFGLIHIDLYHGLIVATYDDDLMPSFYTFPEVKSSIFISSTEQKKTGEQVQATSLSYRPLPPETPVYYARPNLDATSKVFAMVWVEHAFVGSTGSLMMGTLDTATNSFSTKNVLLTNTNGMHDPAISVLNTSGDAVVSWTQSRFNASNAPSSLSAPDMLHAEDVHIALYNAATQSISEVMNIDDDNTTALSGRIDGKTRVLSTSDANSVLMVWPAQTTSNGTSDMFAMWMRKSNGVWSMETIQPVGATEGVDRDLQLVRVADDDIVAVWINERSMDVGQSSVMYSRWNGSAWSAAAVIVAPGAARQIQNITVAGHRRGAVLAVTTTDHRGRSIPSFKLHELWYENGQWSSPTMMHEAPAEHAIRKVASAVSENDRVVVLAEIESNAGSTGSTSHGLLSFVKNQPGSGGAWKSQRNLPALCDTAHQIWHMDAAFGPNDVLYVATQELDTLRANVQDYTNGIRVGASRLNAVLRSAVVNNDLSITAKPFGGQPTDVAEKDLELTLHYKAEMYPAYPDPAHGSSITIPFILQMSTHVDVTIVDVTGRIVDVVTQGEMAEGQYALNVPIGMLQQGLYRVRMVTSTGQTLTMPFSIVR